MNWADAFDGFYFYYDFSINNDIRTKSQIEFYILPNYWNAALRNNATTSASKFENHGCLIDGLKETRTEGCMYREGRVHDNAGEFVFGHEEIFTQRRLDAKATIIN